MIGKIKHIVTFILICTAILSCTKEIDVLKPQILTDYYPLKVGNIITYQVDSTVFVNLGTVKTIRSYKMRDRIDSIITDNLGRPSYKVRRSVRSQLDTTKWIDTYSYLVTYDSTQKRLELVENNLRFIKLASPLSTGVQWNGTSFINSSIVELQYLSDWRFVYENVRRPYTVNGISYTETVTVNQRNDSIGTPTNKSFYFEKTISKEVYSKSIGLIYKEFLHEAWQPANGSSASGYYEPNSYGIKLTILSHNF
ncbi:MAG: hypothetical protein ACK4YD_04275 [Chitinophagia bacterium]